MSILQIILLAVGVAGIALSVRARAPLRIIGIIAGVFLCVSVLLFAGDKQTRHRAGINQCLSNLHSIGWAMKEYHLRTGHNPHALSELVAYGLQATQFICPMTGHKVGAITNVSEWTDYMISGSGLSSTVGVVQETTGSVPFAICTASHGNQNQWHVLFMDGEVRSMPGSDAMLSMLTTNVAISDAVKGGLVP